MNSEREAMTGTCSGDGARPNAFTAAGLPVDYLELAHDLVGIGSYVLNLRTRLLYISREMALLLGAGDAPMEMPIEEYRRRFYAADTYASTSAAAESAYQTGKPLWLDVRVVCGDGRSIWVRTASMVRTNDVGDPVRVGMLRDVTEQREAQDTLARNEQQIRQQAESLEHMALVMEHANDAILMLTEDGRILEANRRTTEDYGYSLEELRQLSIADLREPSTLGRIQEQLKAAGSTAGAVFESTHRRKDGSLFPVEVSSRLVEIKGNRFRLSIIRDISQRKNRRRKSRASTGFTRRWGRSAIRRRSPRPERVCSRRFADCSVETSGFQMAWAGWINSQTLQIEPVAKYGDDQNYLGSIRVYADDRPEGRGPTGTAVAHGPDLRLQRFFNRPAHGPLAGKGPEERIPCLYCSSFLPVGKHRWRVDCLRICAECLRRE